jgi:predicted dehydrogenase
VIKVGIIGLGKMGISHFAIFNSHPDVKVIAVCDPSPLIKHFFDKHIQMKCYSDYKALLEDNRLDCIVVATPNRLHAEVVRYALNKQLDVFCEKPFCIDIEDGAELVALAEKNGCVNQVGYHCRFTGIFQKTKELLDRKVIGKVYHFCMEVYGNVVKKKQNATWRAKKSEGGGCLYDYAAHGIDLVHYLIGKTVSVKGASLVKINSNNIEDAVYSTMECENGISGILSVNWCDSTYRKMLNQITIMGSNGKIIADRQECKLYLGNNCDYKDLKEEWNIFYTTNVTRPVWYYLRGEEYSHQVDYFVSCIKNRELNSISSFKSALQTDIVIDSIFKAAKECK